MPWTSYYTANEANSMHSEDTLHGGTVLKGCGWPLNSLPNQEGFSPPKPSGSCQLWRWLWCWCGSVCHVLFLFTGFIFLMLQEQHFFKTHFSFAIQLNHLFWVINKKVCYKRTLWFTNTGKERERCKAMGMDAKDCWEGGNKKTMRRIWTSNLILEENAAELSCVAATIKRWGRDLQEIQYQI